MGTEISPGGIFLGIDTCGAIGSIALSRLLDGALDLLGEREIAGGELSVALIQAIADLLDLLGIAVKDLAGIRVGLAAVKGLAEAAHLPVVTVSRLAMLADSAQAPCAVLDAHRGQFYCGMYDGGEAREMLLTAGEINAMGGLTGRVAVCEETVAQLLEELYGEPELIRVSPPTAAAALGFSLGKWRAGELADIASLDGYYLRGADAKVGAQFSGRQG
jgi:tRNA threonylcarbamoyladenosine biosynthesis protein TsaB